MIKIDMSLTPEGLLPRIAQLFELSGQKLQVTFQVQVTDDSTELHRVVMLYRELPSTTWKLAELSYDPVTQVAMGVVSVPLDTEIEYFAQAVDGSGNVSVAMSYGLPYFAAKSSPALIYLPVAIKP